MFEHSCSFPEWNKIDLYEDRILTLFDEQGCVPRLPKFAGKDYVSTKKI